MIFVNQSWIIHDIEYVHMIEYMNLEYLMCLRGKCILVMEFVLDTLGMKTWILCICYRTWYIYGYIYIYIYAENGITRIPYLYEISVYVLKAYVCDSCTIVIEMKCFL